MVACLGSDREFLSSLDMETSLEPASAFKWAQKLLQILQVWFALVWHLPFHLHQCTVSSSVTRSQQQHFDLLR